MLYNIADFVNLIAFLALTITTYMLFYFGRLMGNSKGISPDLFILALGINLVGLSFLFRIPLDVYTSPLIVIFVSSGVVFLSFGTIWVLYKKDVEIVNLKKREGQIKSIIAKLREKYYKREMPEDKVKSAYSNLLKKLIEIEVKLGERK